MATGRTTTGIVAAMVAALENGKARRRAAADEAGGLPSPPPDASDLLKVSAFIISDDAVIGIGGCGDLLLGELALDLLEDGFSLEDARVIAVFLHHCGACRDTAYAYDCARENLPLPLVRGQGMREHDYDYDVGYDYDASAGVEEAMSIGMADTTPQLSTIPANCYTTVSVPYKYGMSFVTKAKDARRRLCLVAWPTRAWGWRRLCLLAWPKPFP